MPKEKDEGDEDIPYKDKEDEDEFGKPSLEDNEMLVVDIEVDIGGIHSVNLSTSLTVPFNDKQKSQLMLRRAVETLTNAVPSQELVERDQEYMANLSPQEIKRRMEEMLASVYPDTTSGDDTEKEKSKEKKG